ncbi:MAG: SDR family oxidoreductase [Gemmatimonadetes bacterium]|nr:SDR family oxidoreductase [Gemmatimonadota bacterium]
MKRVVITAAAGGIGRVIAERFVRDGHRVHIADIDSSAMTATLAAVPALKGTVTDVGDPGQVERLFAEAMRWLGGIDVLINNHGIAGPRGFVEDLDYAEWDHCIRVNLSGMFYTVKQAAPLMKAQRSGCIINLSTTSARTGLPKRTAYVAGKVGVLGLTKNLARELGPWNIRCNTILPGFMDNARGRGVLAKVAKDKGISLEAMEQEALRYVSMRTWIDMSEIASACAFLASEEARHISGQEIAVCGNAEWEE